MRTDIFSFELMEAQLEEQQKQQPACRPDRENCPFYWLSFSQPGGDQDSQGLDHAKDGLDTLNLIHKLSGIKMPSQK